MMIIDLGIILAVNVAMENVLERINQKNDLFEEIQAKTRYLSNKKMWNYIALLTVVVLLVFGGIQLGMNHITLDVITGIGIALINTVFENTIYDKMRNTLR